MVSDKSELSNIFEDIVSTTRSVRKRIDFERPIDPEAIYHCVDLAAQAPTSVGNETWRFLVVDERSKKKQLGDIYRRSFDEYLEIRKQEREETGEEETELSPNYRFLADNIHRFPALLLVCREGRPPDELAGQIAFFGSVIPAAWSLMMALRSLRIGSTWTTLHARYEEQVREVLGIPANVTVCILLPIGYMLGANLRRADRASAKVITSWNAWGSN